MSVELIVLFLITVLPLICTPGPDILFAASQGVSGGKRAALRAVAGVLLGYSAHAVLSALGIAALIAASPVLFMTLKWLGVGYLAYLALQLFRSSLQKRGDIGQAQSGIHNARGLRGIFGLCRHDEARRKYNTDVR